MDNFRVTLKEGMFSAFVGCRLQILASPNGVSCLSVKAPGLSPQRWAGQSSTCLLRHMKLPRTVALM